MFRVNRRPFVAPRWAAAVLVAGLWLTPVGTPAGPWVFAAAGQRLLESDFWLQPSTSRTPSLSSAVADLNNGSAEAALAAFSRVVDDPAIGGYARLYQGRAELALGRPDAAARSARAVIDKASGGYLGEAALWLQADASEQAGRWQEAVSALQALTALDSQNAAQAHLRLGRAAFKAEIPMLATQSFTKTYYDFPLSLEAGDAEAELKRYFHWPPASETFERANRRAEALYAGKRYADARKAFEALSKTAPPDARPLVQLRLAECDFHLRRFAAARDGLRAHLAQSEFRVEEATYFYVSALRQLGRADEYVDKVREFVEAHPTDPLAETALNDLATHYIVGDEDEKAVDVFREMLRRFPAGTFADRASWRAGWWAYRHGDYLETTRLFDAAAVTFSRADYRPSWLYWSARANERLGKFDAALDGYRRTIAAYKNSYYGREATRRASDLGRRWPSGTPVAAAAVRPTLQFVAGNLPPHSRTTVIQTLLAAGLFDDAIGELRAVAQDSGPSPFIDASVAYALNRKGELRPGITAMRRAYPQFMADGGEALPTGILKVIFPLDHWDLIRRYATARNLDPYLMAALVAQESTFQADIRSAANAWGLMQIVPATGRRYARSLGIPRFTTSKLTDPEVNIQIGMAHFAGLVGEFGDVADALAAYNAGENRVVRWRAERPGVVDRDEFIDDIPFPETQNYVKRILGTAEDYRILYGSSSAAIVRESGR